MSNNKMRLELMEQPKEVRTKDSWQAIVRIIAYIDMALPIFSLTIMGIYALVMCTNPEMISEMFPGGASEGKYLGLEKIVDFDPSTQELLAVTTFIGLTMELCVAMILLKGVNQRDRRMLQIWFVITVTFSTVWVILFASRLLITSDAVEINITCTVNLISAITRLFVVRNLMNEIRLEGLSPEEYRMSLIMTQESDTT